MNRISAVALLLLGLGLLNLTGCMKPEWPDTVLTFYDQTNNDSNSATILRPNEQILYSEDTAYMMIRAAFREGDGSNVVSKMVVRATVEDGFVYVLDQQVTGRPMEVSVMLRDANGVVYDYDGDGLSDRKIHFTVTFYAELQGPYYPIVIGEAEVSFTLIPAELVNKASESSQEVWINDYGGEEFSPPRTPYVETYGQPTEELER